MSRRALAETSTPMAMLGLGLASLGYGLFHVWPFTIDDAGIVYAYAEHLASGLGLRAVVGGPVVEGYSDFLWMILLAFATKLGFATPLAAKVLGAGFLLLGAVAAAGFVGAAAERISPAPSFAQVLPAVLLGLCPEYVVWAPSGLENALFGAALLLALWLDARESENPARVPGSAIAALALALTRPEGVVYGAILCAAKVSDALRRREYRAQCGQFFALLWVPLALYHGWHYRTFGEIVPNTFFAKAPGAGGWEAGLRYVRAGLIVTAAQWLLPLSVLGLLSGLRRTLPAAGAAAFALAFAVYARGDWMPHARFVGFALPPLVALAAVGVAVASNAVARASEQSDVRRLALLTAVLGVSAAWFFHHRGRFQTIDRIRWCHLCSRTEDVLNHEAERDRLGLREASILTHDFGAPAYASSPSFFPIDLIGLTDRSAGLIEYRRRADGATRTEFARLQYFFHEQATPPTFLYFPEHFWAALRDTPEFLWGYSDVKIPPRKAGNVLMPTRFFRGALIDFFPPVERFAFEPMTRRLTLVGASGWQRDALPLDLEVDVAVVQRLPAPEPVSFQLRIGGATGPSTPLFGEDPSLASTFRRDEPVSVRLFFARPPRAAPSELVEVGIQIADAPREWMPLFPLARVRPASERPPSLPFPNDLPGTSNPTLIGLGRRLSALIDARRTRGDHTLSDRALGASLVTSGAIAEARGDRSDTYLADVWATLADADQIRFLYRTIAALRPEQERVRFLMERALLGKFYESGDAYWQLELAAAYVRGRLPDKALYFLDRLPLLAEGPDDAWNREVSRLRDAVLSGRSLEGSPESPFDPRAIPGVTSDFEAPLAGWTLRGGAFAVANDGASRARVWGTEKGHYLSSEAVGSDGGRAVGTAESSEFTVDGRALSFMMAGGRHPGLSVELVVDGRASATAAPPGSRCFTPVFWDLTPYRGHRAFLRLMDEAPDPDGFVAVDAFEIWPRVEAPVTRK